MERKKLLTMENALYLAFLFAVLLYLAGIFFVNLHSQHWYNYDIYADAMIARQMVEEGSIFPQSWTFGNQLYVVATPVVAAMFYLLCENAILSLGAASCVMTVLTAVSFWWCMKPFTGKVSRMAGLLSLLGGTLIGYSAAVDINGLQVFYTMASYYSCYVIGIFFAMGIWLRLYSGKKVHWLVMAACGAYHFALGIQSLREMLVLHLPLCALIVLLTLLHRIPWQTALKDWSNRFAVGMLGVNALGIVTGKILIALLPIRQSGILSNPSKNLWENFQSCARELWQYMGLHLPEYNTLYFEVYNRRNLPCCCAWRSGSHFENKGKNASGLHDSVWHNQSGGCVCIGSVCCKSTYHLLFCMVSVGCAGICVCSREYKEVPDHPMAHTDGIAANWTFES